MHSVCSRGIGRSPRKSFQPRLCPQCLAHDTAVQGEPYWHLSHQLPNVLFCPEHHCPLLTSCPHCGRSVMAIAMRLIDLPRLKCSCGFDFRNVPSFEPPPDVYLRLAQISVNALNCVHPKLPHEQVRMQLRSLLEESEHERYDLALTSAFKVKRDTNTRLMAELPDLYGTNLKFWLRGYFGMAAAPECCALLVSLGIDFDLFMQGLPKTTSDEYDTSIIRFPSYLWTVDSARLEIVRRVAAYPHRPPSGHKMLYWFLRIHDAQWLTSKFPTLLEKRIPFISEDRRKLKAIANDKDLPASIRQKNIKHISAGMRALIRDRQWLHDRLSQLQAEQKRQADAMHQDTSEQHASAITDALQKLLNEEGRPTRIYTNTLASMIGLTYTQVASIIRTHPQLRETIAAANNDKHRRQLKWAVRQLLSPGHPLSVYEICRLARLPRSAKTTTLIQEIIAEMK